MYLSVPVRKKNRFGQSINDTVFANKTWKKKHLKSIYFSYKGRPYFNEYYSRLEILLEQDWVNLAQLNIALTTELMKWLSISTKIVDSRELTIEGQKTKMLVSICKALGATDYLSNPGVISGGVCKAVEQIAFQHPN